MSDTQLPLQGLKVLDLSRILAGPFCCQILGDLGANVVKVERPGTGDDTRGWGPPFVEPEGPSAYYLSCNRSKRSLALDLSAPAGRAVLHDLIRWADVLLENFLPDSAARLGLSPADLQQLNPQLVSCSISGYGRTGPMSQVPGYDLVIQAASGLMAITGEPEGRPMKVGVAICDVITGLYAAISVLSGLHARRQATDETPAWAFDLSLLDCSLASLVNVAQGALLTGNRPRRFGNAHPHIVPYESFATSDGHLVLAIGNDRQFAHFAAAVDQPAWSADPRFSTNSARVQHRDELIPLLQTLFSQRSTSTWRELLTAHDIPHGPVHTLDELFSHPQTSARQMLAQPADEPYPLLGSPIHWHAEPPRTPAAPPTLGQHTDEILLHELHYTPTQLSQLRSSGVLG